MINTLGHETGRGTARPAPTRLQPNNLANRCPDQSVGDLLEFHQNQILPGLQGQCIHLRHCVFLLCE